MIVYMSKYAYVLEGTEYVHAYLHTSSDIPLKSQCGKQGLPMWKLPQLVPPCPVPMSALLKEGQRLVKS